MNMLLIKGEHAHEHANIRNKIRKIVDLFHLPIFGWHIGAVNITPIPQRQHHMCNVKLNKELGI